MTGAASGHDLRHRLRRNHRRMDESMEALESLNELPRRMDRCFDGDDYLLVARP